MNLNRYVYPRAKNADYDHLLDMWKISCFKVMTKYGNPKKAVTRCRYAKDTFGVFWHLRASVVTDSIDSHDVSGDPYTGKVCASGLTSRFDLELLIYGGW